MPIVSCYIPAFPFALLARSQPDLAQKPVALFDPDERVLAASFPAIQAGVRLGGSVRQARTLCPDLQVHAADLTGARAEFDAILSQLDDFSDAVEPSFLGCAYLDAPDLNVKTAIPFCQDIGRQIRQAFGQALQPAVGCDQGKFTASAAARCARPGAVRVVLGEAEIPFLQPLPIHLLPLSPDQHHLLDLSGIRTLGQFAHLPTRAVFQQFGQSGRLAQKWAQGQDSRPVIPRQKRLALNSEIAFETPLALLPPLLAAAEQLLKPLLRNLQDNLQAAQSLRVKLEFDDGRERVDDWHLSAPTTSCQRLQQHMQSRWQDEVWEAPVVGLAITLQDIQEAPGDQLSLFPGAGLPADHLFESIEQLRVRYGDGRFLRAQVTDSLLLRIEQRAQWREFSR